jgi:hypothetical protein
MVETSCRLSKGGVCHRLPVRIGCQRHSGWRTFCTTGSSWQHSMYVHVPVQKFINKAVQIKMSHLRQYKPTCFRLYTYLGLVAAPWRWLR